jgi:hypothetical protein
LNDPKYLEPLKFEDDTDFECIDLAFDKRMADARKKWLELA